MTGQRFDLAAVPHIVAKRRILRFREALLGITTCYTLVFCHRGDLGLQKLTCFDFAHPFWTILFGVEPARGFSADYQRTVEHRSVRHLVFMTGFALLLAIVAAIAGLPSRAATPPALRTLSVFPEATIVPDAGYIGERGEAIALRSHAGSLVVLNLWATWCAPCVSELPALDRLAAALPKTGYAVLAVSEDKGGAAVARPFLEKLGIARLKADADPQGKLMRAFDVRGLPTTLLILPDGRVHARLEGPAEWDQTEVIEFIRLLGVAKE